MKKKKDFTVVPVLEEKAKIRKITKAGKSHRVEKATETQIYSEEILLESDELSFINVEKDEEIEQYPVIRLEGDTTIIPVVKEVEVISKKLILVKEIHVVRKRCTKIKTVDYTLRSEHVNIVSDK